MPMTPGWYRSKNDPKVAQYFDGKKFTGEERPIRPKASTLGGPRSRSTQYVEQANLIEANNAARASLTPPVAGPPREEPPVETAVNTDVSAHVPPDFSQVVYSSDGQSYWDGNDWVPVPQTPQTDPDESAPANSEEPQPQVGGVPAAAAAAPMLGAFVPMLEPDPAAPPPSPSDRVTLRADGTPVAVGVSDVTTGDGDEGYRPPAFDQLGNRIEWTEIDETQLVTKKRWKEKGSPGSRRPRLSPRVKNGMLVGGALLLFVPVGFAVVQTTSATPPSSTDYSIDPTPSPSAEDPLATTPETTEQREQQIDQAGAIVVLRSDLLAAGEEMDAYRKKEGKFPRVRDLPSVVSPSFGNVIHVMYLTSANKPQDNPTKDTYGFVLCASNPASGTAYLYWSDAGVQTGTGQFRSVGVDPCREAFPVGDPPKSAMVRQWNPGWSAGMVESPDGSLSE